MHEDAGRVDGIGIQSTDVNDFLPFGDADLAAGGCHGIEIPGSLAEDQVAQAIRVSGFDQGEFREDTLFQQAFPSPKEADLFTLSNFGTGARGREEGWNTRAPRPHSLRQGALGHQFDL
jgi:hypothetical protein